MLKEIWAKISYIWFIFMLFIVGVFVGMDKIYGATLTEWTNKGVRVQLDHAGTNEWTSWKTISGDNSTTFTSELTYPVNAIAFRARYSGGLSRDNSYTFRFNFKPTPDAVAVTNFYISNPDGEYEQITCDGPDRYSSGYYWFECTFTPIEDYSANDYIYIKINLTEGYLTELRAGLRAFDERKGTNAIITEQTNTIININTDINNSINNMNDTMKDDSVDDPNDMFEDFQDYLPENAVISSLIGLPITLYTKVLNSVSGTCNSINLGSLYGTNLIMPCIDIDNYLGSTLWNLIDLILSGMFVIVIARKFIKAFDNFTSLKEGDVLHD